MLIAGEDCNGFADILIQLIRCTGRDSDETARWWKGVAEMVYGPRSGAWCVVADRLTRIRALMLHAQYVRYYAPPPVSKDIRPQCHDSAPRRPTIGNCVESSCTHGPPTACSAVHDLVAKCIIGPHHNVLRGLDGPGLFGSTWRDSGCWCERWGWGWLAVGRDASG
jgi:hypothetical protein